MDKRVAGVGGWQESCVIPCLHVPLYESLERWAAYNKVLYKCGIPVFFLPEMVNKVEYKWSLLLIHFIMKLMLRLRRMGARQGEDQTGDGVGQPLFTAVLDASGRTDGQPTGDIRTVWSRCSTPLTGLRIHQSSAAFPANPLTPGNTERAGEGEGRKQGQAGGRSRWSRRRTCVVRWRRRADAIVQAGRRLRGSAVAQSMPDDARARTVAAV